MYEMDFKSTSAWESPLFLIEKGGSTLRLCVDVFQRNDTTVAKICNVKEDTREGKNSERRTQRDAKGKKGKH